jgi:transposase-like protein
MLGLKEVEKRKRHLRFSENKKRAIVEDYLQNGMNKTEIWEKHTGRLKENGSILRWMREFGYSCDDHPKNVTFVKQKITMDKQKEFDADISSFEYLQQKKRITDLEKQLQESEMKAISWQTMVEMAEREFNISIKKKFITKPLKK